MQHRHARLIAGALDKDRKAVLRRAEKLRQQRRSAPPAVVVATLLAAQDERELARPQPIDVDGRTVGRWFSDAAGRLTIQLDPGCVPDSRVDEVVRAVARTLADRPEP